MDNSSTKKYSKFIRRHGWGLYKIQQLTQENAILHQLQRHQILVTVGLNSSGLAIEIPKYIVLDFPGEAAICARDDESMTLMTKLLRDSMTVEGEENTVNKMLLTGKGKGKIAYYTSERLLLKMMENRELAGISTVIFEDALNCTRESDILLGFLKPLLEKRKDLKIIFEIPVDDGIFIAKLRVFFGENKVGALSIRADTLPVTTMYTKQPVADYFQEAQNTVLRIHAEETGEGDIIVFVANNMEARKLRKALESPDHRVGDLAVLVLSENDTNRLIEELSKVVAWNQRTVYIATSKSENNPLFASLNVKYVVDTGVQGTSIRSPITRASAVVRAQMAGFSSFNPSVVSKCFRLYTAAAASSLLEEIPPLDDAKEMSLAKSILRLKMFGVKNILRDFPFFTVPSSSAFARALSELRYLKLIDESCEITELGAFVGNITSLHLRWGVFMGVCNGKGTSEHPYRILNNPLTPEQELKLAAAAIKICGMISAGGLKAALPKYSPGRRAELAAPHAQFLALEGDLISMLNVFEAVNQKNPSAARLFCKENGISFRVIESAQNFAKTYLVICETARTRGGGRPQQCELERDYPHSGARSSEASSEFIQALLSAAAMCWYDQIGKVENDGSLTVVEHNGGHKSVNAEKGSSYYELGPGELRRMQSPWFVYASTAETGDEMIPEIRTISMAQPSVMVLGGFWKQLGPD